MACNTVVLDVSQCERHGNGTGICGATTNIFPESYGPQYSTRIYSILPAAGPTAVACLVLGSMPISATPPTPSRLTVTTWPRASQVGLHFFGQSVGHRQAAQVGAVLAEGTDEMRGGEARRA